MNEQNKQLCITNRKRIQVFQLNNYIAKYTVLNSYVTQGYRHSWRREYHTQPNENGRLFPVPNGTVAIGGG